MVVVTVNAWLWCLVSNKHVQTLGGISSFLKETSIVLTAVLDLDLTLVLYTSWFYGQPVVDVDVDTEIHCVVVW